ncbi:hypothetical protein PTSG_02528 [Salpingoeca rosetta]|uniref:Uncharacterized protein n=1 Tax=Salpingoeca rosetta (strain ATCC 50818 / BSB-021) TaxID=946362 RepID=F2U2G2_SALR5|nr:uncharacterized protein PTSG_02528 [Salpingoeca rosetta]EGD81814.1 hypothetical protein PTSG_02528 [Salpingoeca rosetta]|eukprot:XP_004997018.1 hypothetical protein PTSG_02528 [Salpingoeca rosetta]
MSSNGKQQSSGSGSAPGTANEGGVAHNEGNPVFSASGTMKTSDLYATRNLPERFDNPGEFKGYGKGKGGENPMYQTSSSSYGLLPPNVHTTPTAFHGLNQKFSSHLGQAGMSRNTGLNTAKDKSKVHKALDP